MISAFSCDVSGVIFIKLLLVLPLISGKAIGLISLPTLPLALGEVNDLGAAELLRSNQKSSCDFLAKVSAIRFMPSRQSSL